MGELIKQYADSRNPWELALYTLVAGISNGASSSAFLVGLLEITEKSGK